MKKCRLTLIFRCDYNMKTCCSRALKLEDKHVFKWITHGGSKGHFTLNSLPFSKTFTSVGVILLLGVLCDEAGMGNYALTCFHGLKKT